MSANDTMGLSDVYGTLRRAVAQAGGATAWANKHAISVGYVSDVINARCKPGASVLAAIGLKKVTLYQHAGEE